MTKQNLLGGQTGNLTVRGERSRIYLLRSRGEGGKSGALPIEGEGGEEEEEKRSLIE